MRATVRMRPMTAPSHAADGAFRPETLRFLEEIAANNERTWFQANKHRYEADVLAPALDYIETMGPRIERISGHFVAIPRRVGGSLMRIYRDTRFSHDKTPYKTNIGIQFRHERGKDVHAPGFYAHIEPGRCFLGAGIWRPESSALAAIRTRIVEKPNAWKRASGEGGFLDNYEFGGQRLKRPPRGFAADLPCIEDIKRKDFIASCPLDDDDVIAADLAERTAARFAAAAPLMAFLCAALELQF